MSESILSASEPNVKGGIRLAGWKFEQGEITPSELLVLTAIGAFANGKGECWPSLATISRMTRIKERSVLQNIKNLEEKKILKSAVRNAKSGAKISRQYKILVARHASAMRLKAIKKLLQIDNDGIKKSDMLVLLFFLDIFLSTGNRSLRVRQQKISDATGLSLKSVNQSIQDLIHRFKLIWHKVPPEDCPLQPGVAIVYFSRDKFCEIIENSFVYKGRE